MFKRVEKRRKKKEQEEELGLDEDMKEVLGLQDTDSDESQSDSNSDSESEGSSSEDIPKSGKVKNGKIELKRKRVVEEDAASSDVEEGMVDANDSGDDEGGDDQLGSENDDEETTAQPLKGRQFVPPVIPVNVALHDPLFVLQSEPEIKTCLFCPGKALKSPRMIQVHKVSHGHQRRLRRFAALAKGASPSDNAWDVLQNAAPPPASDDEGETGPSNRAIKRKAKQELLKARRLKQKEAKARAMAKKAAKAAKAAEAKDTASDTAVAQQPPVGKAEKPPKKKRKLEHQPAPRALPEKTSSGGPAPKDAGKRTKSRPLMEKGVKAKTKVKYKAGRGKQSKSNAKSELKKKPRKDNETRKIVD